MLLRAWIYVGLALILAAFWLGAWLFYEYATTGKNPPGFYLTIFLLMGFSALNFIMLGILGEYVGRIFQEVKRRPLYLLRDDDIE